MSWGILPLAGVEWVTVVESWFEDEEDSEVGCRQLGNELGYTPTSWRVVGKSDTPDGSGKQYFALNCQGNEDLLRSCGGFQEDTTPSHHFDIGLRCTFVVAGDECEECPAGKYRYVYACVERRDGVGGRVK